MKEETRRDMEETAHDNSILVANKGVRTGDIHRIHFDKELMDSVRDRDLTWNDAKRVLGHSHEIFNFPTEKKGRKGVRDASAVPMKVILKLVEALSLIRWREEPQCAHLLGLNDEQRKEIVNTLRTLLSKLKTWGITSRDVITTNKKLQ